MSEKWALLAFGADSAGSVLSTLAQSLLPVGLSLEFPGTSVVKVLDDIGEQCDFMRKGMLQLLEQRQELSFQWWWNDSEDLRCTIRLAANLAIVEFDLSGYYGVQECRVVSCFRAIYHSLRVRMVALGFVVDRSGTTALYPWRDILTGRTEMPGEFPDELIVPCESGYRFLRSARSHMNVHNDGENLIFEKETS